MPIYCYSDDDGNVIERMFPMGKQPKSVQRDGKTYKRDMSAEHGGFINTPSNWPMNSDALGVHPDQIKSAERESKRLGVPTHFTPDGRAILRSRGHRKAYMRALGMHDRDGGYGDG